MKRQIINNVFVDNVLRTTLTINRTVYKDKQGEYIKSMGNKHYLINNIYETHYKSISK